MVTRAKKHTAAVAFLNEKASMTNPFHVVLKKKTVLVQKFCEIVNIFLASKSCLSALNRFSKTKLPVEN